MDDAERREPASVHEWDDGLAGNHDRSPEVRLVTPSAPCSGMELAGERAVQLALENGAWSMYDDVEKLVVPRDLEAALAARAGARAV